MHFRNLLLTDHEDLVIFTVTDVFNCWNELRFSKLTPLVKSALAVD